VDENLPHVTQAEIILADKSSFGNEIAVTLIANFLFDKMEF